MSNQHYFDVPFAFSGDVTAIPDPLQTGGTVSFTEGWNYNYQRNLATDPAALPIDRSTMNWLLLQITTALQQLQGGTVPEFILASQNGGVAYPYGAQAEVLWSASGNAPFVKYVNISGATNSNTPSASDPTGATTGWQIACDPLSTAAQAAAGTNNASIMTPLLVAQQTALRALLAGSTSQVFNVAPATAPTHAPQAGQVFGNLSPMCSLAYTNASTLTLSRVRTGLVYSPGYGFVTVPGAGITLTASGLTVNTVYYIYLNPNAGSPTLVASTTGHVTDATGVEVQSGNNSLVLVGMAYALTATTFETSVRSWVNDPGLQSSVTNASAASTASATITNVTTALIVPFLVWAGEVPTLTSSVVASVATANFAYNVQGLLDNVAFGVTTGNTPAVGSQATSCTLTQGRAGLSEGHHTYNTGGASSSGSGGLTFAAGCNSAVQIAPRK